MVRLTCVGRPTEVLKTRSIAFEGTDFLCAPGVGDGASCVSESPACVYAAVCGDSTVASGDLDEAESAVCPPEYVPCEVVVGCISLVDDALCRSVAPCDGEYEVILSCDDASSLHCGCATCFKMSG